MSVLSYSCTHLSTPLGTLELHGSERGLRSIQFVEEETPESQGEAHLPLVECARQLDLYFSGDLQAFHSVSMSIAASDFQLKVWEAAMEIPFGETRTYGQLAEEIKHPKAARAVGTALKQNPLLLIVPCHRIIPSTAKENEHGGFNAGTWRKEWLLRHESGNN